MSHIEPEMHDDFRIFCCVFESVFLNISDYVFGCTFDFSFPLPLKQEN